MSKAKKSSTANIVWFEIPADDIERAKAFYGKLFGWKIQPFPVMKDY
jgi:predicted enzyme related to lactoylglutathione lyase